MNRKLVQEVITKLSNLKCKTGLRTKYCNAMTETDYLLSNSANAKRLLKSVEDGKNGRYQQRDLIEG